MKSLHQLARECGLAKEGRIPLNVETFGMYVGSATAEQLVATKPLALLTQEARDEIEVAHLKKPLVKNSGGDGNG